jgi:hypothetical protein
VHPSIVTIDAYLSASGAPLSVKEGTDRRQLCRDSEPYCFTVAFCRESAHCLRLLRPPSSTHRSLRITIRSQPCLHKKYYRQGELIFAIQFKYSCCPCRSLLLRSHHCRRVDFSHVSCCCARFEYVTSLSTSQASPTSSDVIRYVTRTSTRTRTRSYFTSYKCHEDSNNSP